MGTIVFGIIGFFMTVGSFNVKMMVSTDFILYYHLFALVSAILYMKSNYEVITFNKNTIWLFFEVVFDVYTIFIAYYVQYILNTSIEDLGSLFQNNIPLSVCLIIWVIIRHITVLIKNESRGSIIEKLC